MSNESKVSLLRQQLNEAKAAEIAALLEFRRYETPYYEKAWNRAVAKSQRLAARLNREEMKLLRKARRQSAS